MRALSFLASSLLAVSAMQALAAEPDQAIRETLQALQPDLPIESIAQSPLPGLYQVELQGGRLLYASADGQYVMQGYLYQVKDGQALNLTEAAESRGVAREIAKVPQKDMVIFPAKGTAKTHITVFTDTDCPYCQKLHTEVPALNAAGIEVRYLAFPRQGLGSKGYHELVGVWCSKDRVAAMDAAKKDQAPDGTCDNPVASQFKLGQAVGVQGTPAIVLADGQMIPGYQPAPQLVQAAMEAQQAAN